MENKPETRCWLDDERSPDDKYIQQAFGATPGMIWVKTAQEAIDLLKTETLKSISLDHDLGGAENGTGHDVAKFIEAAAFAGTLKRLHVYIHSQNPVGRANMAAAIRSANQFWLKNAQQ